MSNGTRTATRKRNSLTSVINADAKLLAHQWTAGETDSEDIPWLTLSAGIFICVSGQGARTMVSFLLSAVFRGSIW
jgi:hypothetical protein